MLDSLTYRVDEPFLSGDYPIFTNAESFQDYQNGTYDPTALAPVTGVESSPEPSGAVAVVESSTNSDNISPNSDLVLPPTTDDNIAAASSDIALTNGAASLSRQSVSTQTAVDPAIIILGIGVLITIFIARS